MGKLTTLKVKSLTKPGRYGDGNGLWLQVRDAEHRSWLLRYMLAGRAREMGLGSMEFVTLAQAREAAHAARLLLRQGIDPIDRKRAEVQSAAGAHSFRAVAELYIAAHEASWRNPKHRAQWRSTLDAYVHPAFGDRPTATVQTGDVMRVLEPIWREKPETASRVRGRIETVLDYATARGWRTGDNPARWRGHVANLLPARGKVARVEHHAALPWAEIGAFLVKLRAEDGMSARALDLAILTVARTGEVLGARWSEMDLDAKVWTVPAERMKAGRDHRVPLSDPALDVLRGLLPLRAEADGFVFPGARPGKPLSNMALLMLLRRMGRGDLTAHGFRSTFRDWCAEQTTFAPDVAEMALAHTVSSKVEAAYRRGDQLDKRRDLMRAWAEYCGRTESGQVVQLHRQSA